MRINVGGGGRGGGDVFFFTVDPAINASGTNAAINVKEISLVPRMRL